MSDMIWYKRDPKAFITGTADMTAEKKGVYSTLIDFMYYKGRALNESADALARVCGCSTRRFKILLGELIAAGRLILRGGAISDERFEREIATFRGDGEPEIHQNSEKKPGKNRDKNLEKNVISSDIKDLTLQNLRTEELQKTEKKQQDSLALSGDVIELRPKDDWPEDSEAQFWEAYPHDRRVEKKAAMARLASIRRQKAATFGEILGGLSRYQNYISSRRIETKYIKHPAVWLNKGCWSDVYPTGGGGSGTDGRVTFGDVAERFGYGE